MNPNEIVERVCEGHSSFITDLHYEILGAVIEDSGVDEGNSILHNLRDIIDNYLEGNG